MSKRGEILPTVIIPSFEKPRNPDVRIPLEKAGIPVLSSGIYAYDAIRHLLDFVEYDYSKITPELAIPDAAKTTATKEEKEAAAARKGKHTLSESESKEALSKEGVPVPAQTLIKSDAELEEAIKNFSKHFRLNLSTTLTNCGCAYLNTCAVQNGVKSTAFRAEQ